MHTVCCASGHGTGVRALDSLNFPLATLLTAGTCHAENDEDKKAIVSLRRSVEEDPYNIDSLLALGTR